MGHEDPLYRKIESIVHRVLDEFSEDIGLFDELRADLEKFLEEEDKSAEAQIQSSAEEIDQRDRLEIAQSVAHAEVELRLRQHPTPNFLASFLREQWIGDADAALPARRREQRRLDVGAFDAGRPDLERAAQARDRRAQEAGRDAAQPAEAPARRPGEYPAGSRADASSS